MERELPHDAASEAALLGSIILDPSKTHDVESLVSAHSFLEVRNQRLWEVVSGMSHIDAVLLVSSLKAKGWWGEIGATYLGEIMTSVPVAAHAVHYAEKVAECHYRRRLIQSLDRLIDAAYDETVSVADLKRKAANLLRKILATIEEN